MTIPKWHEFMAPVLHVMSDGAERDRAQITQDAANAVGLTAEDRAIVVATGGTRYGTRVGFAISFLTKAGALNRPQRGLYVINEIGRALIAAHPAASKRDIEVFTGYEPAGPDSTAPAEEESEEYADNPAEMIARGVEQIEAEVADELLQRILERSPAFFEQAVMRLLVAMGYQAEGGEAVVTPPSGDGGIDGFIDLDGLGVNRVYVQAKRYAADNTVQRPQLEAFAGVLDRHRASGVLITTGRFSSGAIEAAERASNRIVLIDGDRLAALLIRFGVGVQIKKTVNIVEIDEDFFE